MSPSPLGRMPLQAIPYRLYHTPITGPDLLHHLVPGLVNPVLSGFGRDARPQEKLGRAALMRGQEKEEDSPCSCSFCYWVSTSVALSIRAVKPSRSARARSGRSGRSSLPAHLCIASVQAGLAPVMAQSMHQQNTILDRV